MILSMIYNTIAITVLFYPNNTGDNFGRIKGYSNGIQLWENKVPNEKITAVANDLGLFFNGCQPVENNACETDHFNLFTGKLIKIYDGTILAYDNNYILISNNSQRSYQSLDFYNIDSIALINSESLRFSGIIESSIKCGPIDILQWRLVNKYLNISTKSSNCGARNYNFSPTLK
jgi:hypothetical protein